MEPGLVTAPLRTRISGFRKSSETSFHSGSGYSAPARMAMASVVSKSDTFGQKDEHISVSGTQRVDGDARRER